MAIAMTPTREIICPGCGRRRTVSDRNARRQPQNCNLCRHPDKRKPPDNSDRLFWLQRFTDDEILEMVYWIFDQEGDAQTVSLWRTELLPAEDVDDVLIKRVLTRLHQKETHDLLPA